MYKAIIDLRIEVHEEKNGKCMGQPLSELELNKVGLKNNFLVVIEGQTKNDCLTKLKEWVDHAKK